MYLYNYRELIKNLVISDLKVKYASSVLGFLWSLLNPLAMWLILYFVFSNVFNNQENFVLYLLIGLITWRFFANGTSSAMGSIVSKPSLVTKLFIPREILTLSTVLSTMISSFLEFLVILPLLIALGVNLHATILLFPIVHLLYFMIIYGTGLILSSLYAYYRDLNQIWEVAMQAGFFVCPIVYPLSYIPVDYQIVYLLNPVTRLMEMYRDIFLTGTVPSVIDFLFVLLCGISIFVIGNLLFARLSRRFAEVV